MYPVVFVLNAARMHEQFFDRAELLSIAEIAQVLQSYPHPHFYRLICLLITLATNESHPPVEADMQSVAAQNNDPYTQQSIHRMADQLPSNIIPGDQPPAHLHSDLCLKTLLDDHLQDADWMLEPSSITALGFPGEGKTTILDHDFSLAHDFRPSTYQGI